MASGADLLEQLLETLESAAVLGDMVYGLEVAENYRKEAAALDGCVILTAEEAAKWEALRVAARNLTWRYNDEGEPVLQEQHADDFWNALVDNSEGIALLTPSEQPEPTAAPERIYLNSYWRRWSLPGVYEETGGPC